MYYQIVVTNIRHNKINTNKNEYVKFNYKNVFKSKTQKNLIIHNLLLKKIIVNRTKLQRSRQKTINYNNNVKKLKNIY